MRFEGLPGRELIERGLADLDAGRESPEAMLVLIGRPRLAALGLRLPPAAVPSPEHRLYALLAAEDPRRAHSRYNALVRRLSSFERSARCAARQLEPGATPTSGSAAFARSSS